MGKKKTTAQEKVEELDKTAPQEETPATAEPTKTKIKKQRSSKYVAAKSYVDRTKKYSAEEAISLARKTHTASFVGTVEAHLVLKDENMSVEVRFPHSTGQTKVVAVATDELLAEIEAGNINFTVLVAHPSMMPKLAKFARVLGPKGLMPNPKSGTVSPDPEKRKAELETGAVTVRTEKKAPLMHAVVGKLSLTDEQLSQNLAALLKAIPLGKLVKCTISSTMGPGIHVIA